MDYRLKLIPVQAIRCELSTATPCRIERKTNEFKMSNDKTRSRLLFSEFIASTGKLSIIFKRLCHFNYAECTERSRGNEKYPCIDFARFFARRHRRRRSKSNIYLSTDSWLHLIFLSSSTSSTCFFLLFFLVGHFVQTLGEEKMIQIALKMEMLAFHSFK